MTSILDLIDKATEHPVVDTIADFWWVGLIALIVLLIILVK